jgi:hypothetical protein
VTVIPERCEQHRIRNLEIPDAQLRICGLVPAHHPGMT